MNFEDFEEVVWGWVQESGALIMEYFSETGLGVDRKEDGTPVTIADRDVEILLRKKINSNFPEHGILGEEFGSEKEDAEWLWMIDPIDGTKSFISGVPLFGTVLCLCHNGIPAFGAIHMPALNEWLVGNGKKTLCNGRQVSCRLPKSISEATLLTSDEADVRMHQNYNNWLALSKRVNFCRTWGDCYGYFLVATGKADIMADPIVSPWDVFGAIPILDGAGAKVSTWNGENVRNGNSAVAAHPELHNEVLLYLNQ